MTETRNVEDLTNKETDVLRALTDLAGEAGATGPAWEEAAVSAGVSRRSFYGARVKLMQAGLVSATEVRYAPVEPPPPPPVSVEDVIPLLTREGTRSRRMHLLYAEVPSDGRLQNLVRIVIDEIPDKDRRGLVKGRRITAEVYEAAEAAVLAAVETLADQTEAFT